MYVGTYVHPLDSPLHTWMEGRLRHVVVTPTSTRGNFLFTGEDNWIDSRI